MASMTLPNSTDENEENDSPTDTLDSVLIDQQSNTTDQQHPHGGSTTVAAPSRPNLQVPLQTFEGLVKITDIPLIKFVPNDWFDPKHDEIMDVDSSGSEGDEINDSCLSVSGALSKLNLLLFPNSAVSGETILSYYATLMKVYTEKGTLPSEISECITVETLVKGLKMYLQTHAILQMTGGDPVAVKELMES